MVENCKVTDHKKYFNVEIDIEENHKLASDLFSKVFTERIGIWRVEQEVGKGYKLGNLFVTFKVYK